jgi:hypothetical protein
MFIKHLLVFIFSASFLFAHSLLAAENSILVKKPPETIKNWYKPTNKRQVWLHTMFRLRRELLAINDYSQTQQATLVKKWFQSFKKDYLEIGEMVPQWKQFLDTEKLNNLQRAVEKEEYVKIPKILNTLKNTCANCHDDYQAVTRLLYRSADFEKIKVLDTKTAHKVSYNDAMNGLSNAVNRIKIAMHDNFYSQAIEYLKPLKLQLSALADGCSDCHQQENEQVDYIFTTASPILSELKEALMQKDNKKARIKLGTFAVKVCARCHSIHRTTAEIKELIE